MEKWMKCNSCFSGKETMKSPFWLTSCGHVFCKQCLDSGGKHCLYCKIRNISSLPLMESSKPEVKFIFEPLDDNFEKLRTASEFQTNQTKIVLDRLLQIEQKYNIMKHEYMKILEENKLLRENLKTSNERFNQYFISSAMQGSLPGTTSVQATSPETEGGRHVVYYKIQNPGVQVENNGSITFTPTNQPLQTLKFAPVPIKKQKARKRISQLK